MSKILESDICVIGAGSGGLSVAAAAASFGVPVVLVEKAKMGGDCLNYGCVPSKAMLAAAKRAHHMRDSAAFGITAGDIKISHAKVHDHIHSVIASIEPNDSVERFTALGVTVLKETGVFEDANTLVAGETRIKARRFVIATGSSPLVPPIPGLDKVPYFTNETLFENKRKLPHLIIIGGGPIGMEMAQAHLRLGSRVTVLEGLKAMGKDDLELAAILLKRLRSEGLEIIEGAMVSKVEKHGRSGARVYYKMGDAEHHVEGTHLLVATGRAANVEGLGLEKAGIEYDRRGIKTRSDLKTSNRKVYAIGDVAGGLQFTHVAGYHAGLVIRGLLFRKRAVPDDTIIPWVTYTDPELAHVGLSEEEARNSYGTLRVLRWPFHENDRAQAERETDGLVKVVTDKRGRILGCSIVGVGAGEMINLWALAVSKKMKASDIAGYVPPYPTLSEAGKRAAVSYFVPYTRKPIIRWLIGLLRKLG